MFQRPSSQPMGLPSPDCRPAACLGTTVLPRAPHTHCLPFLVMLRYFLPSAEKGSGPQAEAWQGLCCP